MIKGIYVDWIDARLSNAIKSFNELMEMYKLEECIARSMKDEILFRGRKSKDILTRWEMFHIPFNKRYLIGNQRYSLTGQPLIYLGKSVIDVIEELNFNREEMELLQLSSFQIKGDLKIYDLRNDIYSELENLEFELLFKEEVDFNKSQFFRSILASICSFEKRKEREGFSFCEEYVIPQILAQSVKNKGYDGIIYYSTKRFQSIGRIEEEKKQKSNLSKLKYKENIALFTNFNESHVYDKDLYSKLKISVPIDINKIENISIKRLGELEREIELTRDQQKISQVGKILQVFKREFEDLMVGEKKYCETSMGMLHIYHIYVILSGILIEGKEE